MDDDLIQPLIQPHHILIDMPKHDQNQDENKNTCRICFEGTDESTEPLFQPCRCDGTNRYIHRSCLNQWRATAQNPEAFRRCFTCNYEYQFQHHEEAKMGECSEFNQNLADSPAILCILVFIILVSLTYGIQSLDHHQMIIKFYESIDFIKLHLELFDLYFFIYYIFVAHLTFLTICILFIINIVRMKNRIMYLKYCFGRSPVTRCIFFGIILPIIFLSFFISSGISSVCITLIIQFLIRTHYNFLKHLHRATASEIAPYSGVTN